MLDPEDNSTILPLQSGWGGGGVGDCGGWGRCGGRQFAEFDFLSGRLAGRVGDSGGANWSDRCLCVFCLCVHMSVFNAYSAKCPNKF